MRIKIDATDKIFSLYIRTRDNWTCQRCGTRHPRNSQGLHCAHIFGRGRHSVRWNEANSVALCYGCHSYLDQNPRKKEEWYRDLYGSANYDKLEVVSNTPSKFTTFQKKQIRDMYKEKTKELT